MAKSVQTVAEEIRELIRKNNKDAITFSWVDFYQMTGRERIKDAFMKDLSAKLNGFQLLICYGQAVVLIGKDYNFSVVKI